MFRRFRAVVVGAWALAILAGCNKDTEKSPHATASSSEGGPEVKGGKEGKPSAKLPPPPPPPPR